MGNREEAVTVSDCALDREIELALAVQPSPEFVARLRTAVTAGPPAQRQDRCGGCDRGRPRSPQRRGVGPAEEPRRAPWRRCGR